MQTTERYLDMNTTTAKPFAVWFSNFGYYSNGGPCATLEEAKELGKASGFEFQVYKRGGKLCGSYQIFGGWRAYA